MLLNVGVEKITKRGQLKTIISLLLLISIFFITVFGINQNETNSSLGEDGLNVASDLDITPDISLIVENDTYNAPVDVANHPEDNSANESLDAITGSVITEGSESELNQSELILNESIPSKNITNLTLPLENVTIAEISVTDNLSAASELSMTKKDIKNLINLHKDKLNEKTEEYLENIKNKEERNEYLVSYKKSFNKDKIKDIEEEYLGFNIAKIGSNITDIEDLIDDSDIEYIELDQGIESLEDNIPYNIQKTKAPSVWDITKGNGVRIAILDTGISQHDDLAVSGGYSVISDNYDDNNGHGTAVAGVVSALLNEYGLAGVAPEADIYAVKIMEDSTGHLSDAIEGIEWAIDNNMDIISMSFGMESYSQIFKEVIEEAYDNNILLIAATGNNGENNILYPAAYSDVIAVGAVDENNEKALFSNYGFELELVAPGVNINTTYLDDGYTVASGTSIAVPHVVGAAALIKSYNQILTNSQIRAKLRNDALDLGEQGKDDYYGFGLVQINLESQNYTIQNLSYYYEIFNITNFRNKDETRVFWISGFGTVDDLDFNQGYYAVNKTINNNVINEFYYVDENGILKLLTTYAYFYDDFSEEGSSTTDGITWINGMLKAHLGNPPVYLDAECWDFNWNDVEEYTDCFFDSGDYSACLDYSQSLGSGDVDGYSFYYVCAEKEGQGGYTCYEGTLENHSLDTSSIQLYNSFLVGFVDCDNSQTLQDNEADASPGYVIDKKRAHCTGTTTFDYQGRYGTDLWVAYKSTSCPSGQTCDSSLDDQEVSTKTGTIPNPCAYGTDLAILEVIPIQVIPNVDMVKGKSGYVRVVVHNYGPLNATGQVNVTFDGSPLVPYNPANATLFIANGANETFDFSFTPDSFGSNLAMIANVGII